MSETDFREFCAVVRRAAAVWVGRGGVHMVGPGRRERRGRPTDENVITMFVCNKRSARALDPSHLVPRTFEGIPTDVVESAIFEPIAQAPAAPFGSIDEDDEWERPLIGGARLQTNLESGFGSLGFFVQRVSDPEDIMAMTCFHCVFGEKNPPQPAGQRVGQPVDGEGFTGCTKGNFGTFLAGHYDSIADAALVRLDPKMKWKAEIKQIGLVKGAYAITDAEARSKTYKVRKRGMQTLLTRGLVDEPGFAGDNGRRAWSNALLVKPDPEHNETVFADGGDSGSALVNKDNKVIGLIFAANRIKGDAKFGWALATPIVDVLNRFKAPPSQGGSGIEVSVFIGDELGKVRTTPPGPSTAAAAPPRAEETALIARLEDDLHRTARGRRLTELWFRHSSEFLKLVRTDARVAARWRRYGGSSLLQRVLRASALGAGQRLPPAIKGRPTDDCVALLLRTFEQYGSVELRRAIEENRELLPSFAARTYPELLESLREGEQR